MRKQDRYNYVLDYLSRTLSDTETELDYSNNFELLVAVVLSAQCTDKRINQITPRLFADYPTPEAMALASPEVLFDYIKTVSYPNNKAKHLQGLAQGLVERFGGEVPSTLEELTSLPGVGRKNCQCHSSGGFSQSGHGGRYARLPCGSSFGLSAQKLYHTLQRGDGAHAPHPR